MTSTVDSPQAAGGAAPAAGDGRVVRITGPVVDIEFSAETMPAIYNALQVDITIEGQTTVLTGSLTADQLERLPARKLIGPIHFALLDCPDDVLADRLRGRPAWRGTSSPAKITEHQRFAAWLRARVTPSFDTSSASTAEVADRIAAWVTALLPGTQLPT